jgi:thiamine monophosphate synthase
VYTYPEVGLYGESRGTDALSEWPLVYNGRILAENSREVIEAGAGSVAMISGLLGDLAGGSVALRDLLAALRL